MHLLVLPGDGIGPEITRAALDVLATLDSQLSLNLSYETRDIGLASLERTGTTLPDAAIDAARAADGILVGPVSHLDYPPRTAGGINVSGELRIVLDLYANIRPSRSRRGLPSWGRTGMDLVICRENTEGFYADRNMHLGLGEFMPTPDVALSVRKITAFASRRIAQLAFGLARGRRRKVTAVHKANVLKITEGLFLREVRKAAAEHADVTYEEQLVDSMAALLVRDAARFDVIVTTNMFGDILSDEAAELSGSLGLGAALNCGDDHGMAQAAHGSAPDIAGQDRANPVSLILSAAMLLEWLGRRHADERFAQASRLVHGAVDRLLEQPDQRTRDLGGPLGTRAFTAALCRQIAEDARTGGGTSPAEAAVASVLSPER